MSELETPPASRGRQPNPIAARLAPGPLAPGLLAAGLLAVGLQAGCGNSGGVATAPGGGSPPGGETPVAPSFAFGRTLRIADGSPGDVLVRDLDRDSFDDLVVTDFLNGEVLVARGMADGSFLVTRRAPTLGQALRSVVGDFDRDGRLDVASLSIDYQGLGAPAVHLLLQGSDGSFSETVTLPLASDAIRLAAGPSSGIVVDGPAAGPPERDDLFLSVPGERAVLRLRLGEPEGVGGGRQLEEVERLDTSSLRSRGEPLGLVLVDRDGDGDEDLILGESGVAGEPDRLVLFPREADGGFAAPSVLLTPTFDPLPFPAGDLDGDGAADVGIAQLGASQAIVLFGSTGGAQRARTVELASPASSLAFADLDRDGDADLAATLYGVSAVSVHLAEGSETWGEGELFGVGFVPRALSVLRLPGDDVPDLLCSDAFALGLLEGAGGGDFLRPRGFLADSEGPIGLAAADLDEDGTSDLVTISVEREAIGFWRGEGDGALTLVDSQPTMPSALDEPGGLAIGDLDGDGRMDAIAPIHPADEVRVYFNGGALDAFEPEPFRVPAGPLGTHVADIDGDGLPDLVVAAGTAQEVALLWNEGGGELALAAAVRLPPGRRPGALRAGDLDDDGDLDLVVTTGRPGAAGATLAVLEQVAAGELVHVASHPVDAYSTSLELADLDADGFVEVVLAQPGRELDDLFLFRHAGRGVELVSERLEIGPSPNVVLVRDLDRDGRLDLVVGSALGELRLAFGDGLGGFPELVPLGPSEPGAPAVFEVQDLALADLDGDGLAELLSVAPHAPLVWVSANTSVEQDEP